MTGPSPLEPGSRHHRPIRVSLLNGPAPSRRRDRRRQRRVSGTSSAGGSRGLSPAEPGRERSGPLDAPAGVVPASRSWRRRPRRRLWARPWSPPPPSCLSRSLRRPQQRAATAKRRQDSATGAGITDMLGSDSRAGVGVLRAPCSVLWLRFDAEASSGSCSSQVGTGPAAPGRPSRSPSSTTGRSHLAAERIKRTASLRGGCAAPFLLTRWAARCGLPSADDGDCDGRSGGAFGHTVFNGPCFKGCRSEI